MRRKRHSLSILQKMEIINMIDRGMKYADIARNFDIHRMTVQGIKNRKKEILSLKNYDLDKKRITHNPISYLEKTLYDWIVNEKNQGKRMTKKEIKSKALQLLSEHGRGIYRLNKLLLFKFKNRFYSMNSKTKDCESEEISLQNLNVHEIMTQLFQQIKLEISTKYIPTSDDNICMTEDDENFKKCTLKINRPSNFAMKLRNSRSKTANETEIHGNSNRESDITQISLYNEKSVDQNTTQLMKPKTIWMKIYMESSKSNCL
ncbi:hypothetical protein A3Q56_03201 [Intoshia linei]|uniref:HTH psq-type domain-containing protein n=1 Tax=Intoshia linei TaxID=1819745 RepID=A0A177B455_9BILA|nr:hypothetical protein A3Q56_03201 [Intoshia linei]